MFMRSDPTMVRIKDRPTACLTCLKRKKGCDRQKPSCGQCRKSCIPCLGYNRPYKFRHTTAQDFSKAHASLSLQRAIETGGPNNASQRQLMRSACIANMLDTFWEVYLPDGQQLNPKLGVNSTWGVVKSMGNVGSQTGALGKATAAMCLAAVDLQENNKWMQENSLRYYTEALHDVATALSQPGRNRTVSLMCAIRIFSIYESFFIKADRPSSIEQSMGWTAHLAGEISLLLSSGPAFYSTGLAHRVFVDDRLFLISLALQNRRASFLTEQAWLTLPWKVTAKAPRDRLLDILAHIPTAFESFDEYYTIALRDPISAEPKRQNILQFCLRISDELALWCAKNLTLVQSAAQIKPLWDMDKSRAPLDQSEITILHIASLYWGTLTLVQHTLRKILRDDESKTV
ncbi:hypothetical protein BDV26DRAFT_254978 [Aspergillus bertholletiae]|uniref:Zn(2)-C6 fungal-type domain-containing protein n=1 Tax=Aspergillus bertholletiae TaxID=1226010 RepID=A0A5N7BIT1_9EURO|nr:hypothetical protein BDV26DRAFT_254978 [Aspergillus bertholletiae]